MKPATNRGINPDHVVKIRLILFPLQSADTIEMMRLPSFRLHLVCYRYYAHALVERP